MSYRVVNGMMEMHPPPHTPTILILKKRAIYKNTCLPKGMTIIRLSSSLITRDVPLPVVQVAVADFDGDGVIDIISLSSVSPSNSECYQATVHWCDLLVNKSVVVKGESTI